MSERYYIASLKHTNSHHEHIVFWQHSHRGYTPVLGEHAGRYSESEAKELNDGESSVAIPVEVVDAMASPEPYHQPGRRFYDQRGPVINNARDCWRKLLAESMKDGRKVAPKPTAFRGKRRAIFTEKDN